MAADGYITDDRIEIGINKNDSKIIEKFRDMIAPDKPIYEKINTNASCFSVSSRKHMKKFKKFFNMLSNKKHEEIEFPNNIPDVYIKDFIRGVIDGDGCIDTTKGYKGDKVYIGPRLRILGNYKFLYELNKATKKYTITIRMQY